MPQVKEPTQSRKACRKTWAKLISRVYQTDPLICPKCRNQMKIIAFIEDQEPVKAILKHLHLRHNPRRAPPKKVSLPQEEGLWSKYSRDERESSIKYVVESWAPYAVDPEIPADAYFQDHEYTCYA